MSQWHMVEAEPASPVRENKKEMNRKDKRSNNSNNRNNRRNNNNGYKTTRSSNKNLGFSAVRQIELLLSPENLAMDTYYIRPYMDEEGYIPIAYLCNFPNVLSINAAYEDILAAFEHNANSSAENEKASIEANPTPAEASAKANDNASTSTPTKSDVTPAPISPALHKKYETKVDFDRENELIRLKKNWKMWLMPNGEGGLGLPRYTKQVTTEDQA